MLSLTRHGTDVGSVFDLLGTQENDLTAALGFALSRCPQLAGAVAARLVRAAGLGVKVGAELSLALEVRADGGRTDLEIRSGSSVFIVEAKAGWRVPSAAQLAQYSDRVSAAGGKGALVSLSQASHALAGQNLPEEVSGVPVIHLAWRDVLADIERVMATSRRPHQRMWLEEFRTYLMEVIRVRRVEDSWTYCVVLSNDKPGGTATFKEIVTEQLSYFHPYGVSGWPSEPPNFMAFRWEGAVRRIHRVIGHEVVPQLSDRWPEMTGAAASRPHAVYRLGPRLPPHDPIANGSLYRSSRFWVLLDQLQTAPTLAEAIARSKELAKRS